MKSPHVPATLLAVALLVALTIPAGCRLLPTKPDLLAARPASTPAVHARRDGPAADSVHESYYVPNPYFGHVRSMSVETAGHRARLTAIFDRPFGGQLGARFQAFAAVYGRPDTLFLRTEGAHRCIAYRLVVRHLPGGGTLIGQEVVGTSNARAVNGRLVLEFSADLLPQAQFARELLLSGGKASGDWRQDLKQPDLRAER